MHVDGVHHVTAITADADRNLDFYVGTLGLRLVKTTVNFDAPDMYHLYLGDTLGRPGSILTFFEIPGAGPGNAGPGMIHRVVLRVATAEALGEWERRLRAAGRPVETAGDALISSDPEGLGLELRPFHGDEPALTAAGLPREIALTGVEGVRMFSLRPERTREVAVDALGFADDGEGALRVTGPSRSGRIWLDALPDGIRRTLGAGTVHHVAWAAPDAEHAAWPERLVEAGLHPTGVIDRQYFRSVYFREPGGILFEIASAGPGFAVDEPEESLGEQLRLPPQYETLRSEIERRLRPLERPPVAGSSA